MTTFYTIAIDNDAIFSRFCSVAVPVYFLYSLVMWGFCEKIEQYLIKMDNYTGDQLKIRPISIIITSLTTCFLALSFGYFMFYKTTHFALFFGLALLGYLWVMVNTYCVRIRFTDKAILYHAWSVRKNIQFSDVSKICWESTRHSIGYVLVIYCTNGNKISLSSRDFVGLVKLKNTYELSSNAGDASLP